MTRAATPLPQRHSATVRRYGPARRARGRGGRTAVGARRRGADSSGHIVSLSYLLDWLGWFWLLWWTAWRMRPVQAKTRVRRL